MEYIFTPEHIAIVDLFGDGIKYSIPEYQRPYSWDCIGKSDKNNQVNTMWDDLINYFRENPDKNEYFFGSMVLIENGNRNYEVIDGQQRLTTLNILFASVKCFLNQIKNSDSNIIQANSDKDKQSFSKFIENAINEIDKLLYNIDAWGLVPEKKLKIEKFNGFDYDNVLKMVLECKSKTDLGIINANDEQKQIALRYFNNRDFFTEKLFEEFCPQQKFAVDNAKQLDKFVGFLKYRLSLVRIKTPNFNCAYQIFEILNNRGLPLSNKDLLRNFIIKEFDRLKLTNKQYEDIYPSEKWNYLDQNYLLDTDFIGRWVESRKASQQKFSAFNDLLDMYSNKDKLYYIDDISTPKILKIYTDIIFDLENYTAIRTNQITNLRLKSKIAFLLNAGNERYTINLLLSLFRALPIIENTENELINFVNEFEKYVIYVILNRSTKFSNAPIYRSISYLNNGNIESAKRIFSENTNIEELRNLIDGDIKDNSDAKLLICKYLLYQDSQIVDDVVNQTIIFDRTTLEHIIPQNPEKGTNWFTDFSDSFRKEYTYRLGNFTLLTKALNSSANNHDFIIKKKDYKKTKLAFTQNLVNLPLLNESYIENRHKEIINAIFQDLMI